MAIVIDSKYSLIHSLKVSISDSLLPGVTEPRPARMTDQLNAGATSETKRTWKTIHTIHVPIHSSSSFTTLLTSQVISVAFYSEREKSDKYCSEVLISVWGSFTFRKSTTRDTRLYFLSEGSHIYVNRANVRGWLWRPWGKNLIQETCSDRDSNPGPLRDRRACYRLLHSGGRFEVIIWMIWLWKVRNKA